MYKKYITVALFLFSTHAFAEDGFEEIVVTGLRNDVSLQDAPSSVTVFTRDEIKDASITRNSDYLSLTTGVNLVQGATLYDSQVSIRGLYNARLTESNYALIVDGILIPNPGALNRELIDVAQIEVIKGAQSALYGRNAIAGAIIINTVKPSGGDFAGSTRMSYGNNNAAALHQTINIPISDDFGLKVSFGGTRTDGFYHNAYSDQQSIDDSSERDYSIRFYGQATDAVTIDVKVGGSSADSGAVNFNSFQQGYSPANGANPVVTTDINNVNIRYLNNVNNRNEVDNLNISAKLIHDYGDDNSLTVLLSRNEQETTLFGDGTNAQATYAAAGAAFGQASMSMDFINGVATVLGMNDSRFSSEANPTLAAAMFLNTPANAAEANTILRAAFAVGVPAMNIPGQPNYAQCLTSSLSATANNPATAPYNYTNNFPTYGPTTCDGYQYQERNQSDSNFELRYSSNPKQTVAWVAGFSLHRITTEAIASIGEDRGLPIIQNELNATSTNSPTTVLYSDDIENNVAAVFGSLNVNITESFNITFDGRYDRETKTVKNNVPNTSNPHPDALNNPNFNPISACDPANTELLVPTTHCGVRYLNILYNFNGGNPVADVKNTYSQFQPKLALSYRPEDTGLNLYASYGLGFRSGGFNFTGLEQTINFYYCPNGLRAPDALQPCNAIFGPNPAMMSEIVAFESEDASKYQLQVFNVRDEYKKETSDSFEAGLKAVLDDGNTVLDFAMYNNEIKNLQTFNYFAGAFGLLYGITNIDEATVTGIEFSAKFLAAKDFSLGFGLSSISSEIVKNTNRPYTKGNAVPFIPENDANFFMQYKGAVSDQVEFLFRMDFSYTGVTWFSEVQDDRINNVFTKNTSAVCSLGANPIPNSVSPCGATTPTIDQTDLSKSRRNAFSVVNMRLDLIAEQSFRFGVWGKNILDERYPVEVIAAPEAGQSFVLESGGASYGIEFSASY